jgi:glycosyltransferase involved in cell wall biosynthesis
MSALSHLAVDAPSLLVWLVEVGLWLLLVGGAGLLLRGGLWALRAERPRLPEGALPDGASLPRVTVQLPLRNERHVVEGLLRYVAQLDWPREQLEIQVLDDSDDETVQLVDAEVARLRAAGFSIEALRRSSRRGYKAGALQAALPQATGELFLLLDADSRPRPDLLRQLALPLTADPKRGFVQARWAYGNERAGLLTRTQALLLDGWFALEQPRTAALGQPVQLNGTSALVRRSALLQAGGWLRDGGDASVTEDLDLSARMAEAGFHGETLAAVSVETELPDSLVAYRAQQVRWLRGAGEVIRAAWLRDGARGAQALLGPLVRHLRQPAVSLWLLVAPLRSLGLAQPALVPWGWPLVLGLLLASAALYYGAARRRVGRSFASGALGAPLLVTLQVGMSLPLTVALLRGLFERAPGEFVRTPKRGASGAGAYRARGAPAGAIEALLGGLYLLFAGRLAVEGALLAAVGVALFPAAGLLWVGLGSLRTGR